MTTEIINSLSPGLPPATTDAVNVNDVRRFVYTWFTMFEHRAPAAWLTRHLAADARAARRRGRPGPPTKLTVWLFCALAAVVLAVTIVMIVRSGAAPCIGAAPVHHGQRHAQIPGCPPKTNPVPGRR